jgi:DNA-binding NarL/FixJ family response regulator
MKRDKDNKRKPWRIVYQQYINIIKPSELTDEEWHIWEETNKGLYQHEIASELNIQAWQVSKVISKVVNVLSIKQNKNQLSLQVNEEDFSEVERRCRSRHIYMNNLQSNVCPITGKLVKTIMSNFF